MLSRVNLLSMLMPNKWDDVCYKHENGDDDGVLENDVVVSARNDSAAGHPSSIIQEAVYPYPSFWSEKVWERIDILIECLADLLALSILVPSIVLHSECVHRFVRLFQNNSRFPCTFPFLQT